MNIIAILGIVFAAVGLFLPCVQIDLLFSHQEYSLIQILTQCTNLLDKFDWNVKTELIGIYALAVLAIVFTAISLICVFFKTRTSALFSFLALTVAGILVALYIEYAGDYSSLVDFFANVKYGMYFFLGGHAVTVLAKLIRK